MTAYRYFDRFVPEDIEAALGRRYIVGPEVGVGGQGAVFTATRISRPDGTPTNDSVALKLHLYPSQDIRVQREITAMENLSHPNLARLIEHGSCELAHERVRYIAWELIEGKPLSAQLKHGPLLESEVLAIGRDVSAAIAEIWTLRIVHGDIKPSNIMLRNSGDYITVGSVDNAVLIDLGGASFLNQDDSRSTLRPSRSFDPDNNTAALKPLGTLGYFSPERYRGEKALSYASDVFSLGVVMMQCLLGWHPTAYDQNALADGIQASRGKVPASSGLLLALDRMLSPRPALRPNPAELSRRFQGLRQMMRTEYGTDTRAAVKAQD